MKTPKSGSTAAATSFLANSPWPRLSAIGTANGSTPYAGRASSPFVGPAAELAEQTKWDAFIAELQNVRWAVWPRPTACPERSRRAAGPARALDYLGRYAYRVAISDYRILKLENGRVTFSWRDRSDANKLKTSELPAQEFITRFLYHILPPGFQKIRYYGWLSPTKKLFPLIRKALNVPEPPPPPKETSAERILRLTGVDIRRRPNCGKPSLVYIAEIPPRESRAPP